MKLPPHKNTKSADHHYFPRSLQKFWRNAEGWVTRLAANGAIKQSKNGTFGHVRNAHHIKVGGVASPWDETFEHFFNSADNSLPPLVRVIANLTPPALYPNTPWTARLSPVRELDDHRPALAECVASLAVRSPGSRNLIKVMVESYGVAPEPDKLISINQKHMLESYRKALTNGGKFLILHAGESEFVFGDGCLNNFRSGGAPSPMNARCLVPLTPHIAVLFDSPMSYMSNDTIWAVTLDASEVAHVNQITMIYSKDYIFYRSTVPEDLSELASAGHRQLRYHCDPWFEGLMSALADAWAPP